MHDVTDMDLLRQYAAGNSDAAFAELVSRHVNLVYSAALRKTGNPHAAEEITQAVFIILAQKAGRIPAKTILPGWLYQTARLTASGFLRGEIRRVRREQEAYMQTEPHAAPPEETWEQLAPLLDDAMGQLGEKDRAAVVLRFFGGKSFAEVAAAAGVSENAAKKRVNYALEKLHRYFSKHGVHSTTAIIAGTVSTHSVSAAPAGLAKAVTAIAVAKGATASISTLTLIKGALKIMAWTQAKTAIVAATAIMLATSVSVVVVEKPWLIQGKTEDQWIKSIVYFGDDNQTKRWRAIGPRGIRMLVHALKNPAYDHPTRMCVADLLSRLGNDAKSAIPDIINQIHIEKDDSVRQIELGYFEVPLQTMSEKEKASLFPELLRAMQSENSGVRNNALVALQFYPLEPVIPIMVGSLQDSDAYVRLNAARELNKLDPRSAAKADIVRVLADCSTNSDTDNEAVVALGDIHLEPEVAVPALIQCLQSSKAYVRANAAVALGRFGSQARPAMAALQRALDDSDDSVRRQATTALKRINSGIVPNQGFH